MGGCRAQCKRANVGADGGAMCRRVASDRRERLGSNRKVNTRGSVAAIDRAAMMPSPSSLAPSRRSPRRPTCHHRRRREGARCRRVCRAPPQPAAAHAAAHGARARAQSTRDRRRRATHTPMPAKTSGPRPEISRCSAPSPPRGSRRAARRRRRLSSRRGSRTFSTVTDPRASPPRGARRRRRRRGWPPPRSGGGGARAVGVPRRAPAGGAVVALAAGRVGGRALGGDRAAARGVAQDDGAGRASAAPSREIGGACSARCSRSGGGPSSFRRQLGTRCTRCPPRCSPRSRSTRRASSASRCATTCRRRCTRGRRSSRVERSRFKIGFSPFVMFTSLPLAVAGADDALQIGTADVAAFCRESVSLFEGLLKPTAEVVISSTVLASQMGRARSCACYLFFGAAGCWTRLVGPAIATRTADVQAAEGELLAAHARLVAYAEEVAMLRGGAAERALLDGALDHLAASTATLQLQRFGSEALDGYVLRYLGILAAFTAMMPAVYHASTAAGANDPTEYFLTCLHLLVNVGIGVQGPRALAQGPRRRARDGGPRPPPARRPRHRRRRAARRRRPPPHRGARRAVRRPRRPLRRPAGRRRAPSRPRPPRLPGRPPPHHRPQRRRQDVAPPRARRRVGGAGRHRHAAARRAHPLPPAAAVPPPRRHAEAAAFVPRRRAARWRVGARRRVGARVGRRRLRARRRLPPRCAPLPPHPAPAPAARARPHRAASRRL